MKTGVTAVAAASWLLAISAEAATEIDIGNCDQLMAAAQATSSGDVLGTLTSGEISCGQWTTLEITANRLKLVGDATTAYKLDNARFSVGEDGVFRSDVPMELTGDNLPDVILNGSVLNVEKGGRARFMAPVKMYDVQHNGGQTFGTCLYNEGTVRFEDDFTADACSNLVEAQGGCVWNGGDSGEMVFKGEASMSNCGSVVITGGAVYNTAKMSFYEDAMFSGNRAASGGAIWNGGEIKFLKRSEVLFESNEAGYDDETGSGGVGGHVANYGALVFRNEAIFDSGRSGSSGGAIYFRPNSNVFEPTRGVGLTFLKPVQFSNNNAGLDGGAIAIAYEYVDSLPKQGTYSGNVNDLSGNDGWCRDIYIDWDGESEEDGYICAPCNSPFTTCATRGGELVCGALTCAELTFPQ